MEQRVKVYLTLEAYIDMWRNAKWNMYGWLTPKTGYVVEMLIHNDDITSLNDQGGISFQIRPCIEGVEYANEEYPSL